MTITVTPNPLVQGQQATVSVQGSSHGGETIEVEIDDGTGNAATLEIALDDDGNGSAEWTVPDWNLANFRYSTCPQITRMIQGPDPDQ